MPALPGAHHSFVTSGDAAIFHARACSGRRPEGGRWDLSRPPEPPRPGRGGPDPTPLLPGATGGGEPGTHPPDRAYGFRACPFGAPRNDGVFFCPPAAAMISCSVAT